MVAFVVAVVPAAAHGEPLPVREIPSEPTGFAKVEGGTGFAPKFTHGKVFVATTRGVTAYARRCTGECNPLWRSRLRAEHGHQVLAARSGHVAVGLDSGLSLFEADCANNGSVCEPEWAAARGDILSLHIVGSSVVAAHARTGGVRVSVYPLDCADPCTPTWSRLLRGGGPSYGPSVLAFGVLYVRRGAILYGVDLGCATAAEQCSVVFRVGQVPDATFPAVTPDLVVFGTGGGTENSELAAYPTNCGQDCAPAWTVDTGDYVGDAPTIAGNVVVVPSTDVIRAFPLDCVTPCAPAWTAEVGGYAIPVYEDDEWLVAVARGPDRAVYVFPSDCSGSCPPAWWHAYTDRTQEPMGTAVDGGNLFVAFPGHTLAYRIATGERVWRGKLHRGAGWWVDVGPRSLALYLKSAGYGMLDVFGVPEP
jgi:hypothetical protein